MKTLGILGGMSSQSTIPYYRLINEGVNRILGGHHAPEMLIYSVNFQYIETFLRQGQWDEAAAYLSEKAAKLEKAGADFLLLATNTMHRVAPQIEQAISIPLIHIVDVTAEAILKQGMKTVGILGTKPTMEAEFYTARFRDKFGITPLVPSPEERQRVHAIIFDELCRDVVTDASRQDYLAIMRNLTARGAEGIILGCTEIGMLIASEDFPDAPLFDTTILHAQKAVTLCLEREPLPIR